MNLSLARPWKAPCDPVIRRQLSVVHACGGRTRYTRTARGSLSKCDDVANRQIGVDDYPDASATTLWNRPTQVTLPGGHKQTKQ